MHNKTYMKTNTTFVIALLVLSVSTITFANDGKFIEAMQKNIQTVYQAESIDQLQTAVNAFERIGAAEKTKWEPQYYAAFGYIMMCTRESDGAKKDAYLDLAMTALEKGKVLAPEESELIALEGFTYMMKLTIDPASRGAQFSGLAMQSYSKAVALNPENPRALGLLAQMQYGTAQFFGSSTNEACETGRTALQKFETYKSENPLAPQWGKPMTEEMVANCK
jgi:hypothetical protein